MSPKFRPYVRGAVDYGGPLVFFVAYLITRDMIAATWALVAGSAVALAIGFAFERRLAPMPLLAGGAALIFGALTLIFHDARFVKMKPTFLNTAFAVFLLGGVMLKRNPLKVLLGEAVSLPEDSWRTLTLRYGVFFLCVAILNEVVWRTQPEATWVVFRFPGLQILALAFSAAQVPLMMKGMKAMETVEAPPPPVE